MTHRRYIAAAGLALGVAILGALPADAQSTALKNDERAYCNQLAGKYSRHLPTRAYGGSLGASPSVATSVALQMCNDGRAAEAIPQLEKALRAAGYSVPETAVGARR
jgi:hypothetical protein